MTVPDSKEQVLYAGPMNLGLEQSRAYCEHLTRTQARNFYYGLKLLPDAKRAAMFAIYAYMRLVDDIADEDDGRSFERRVADLETWRVQTHAVLEGNSAGDGQALWPAFAEVVHRYALPHKIFDDVIAGQKQDLDFQLFKDFEALFAYCYRVAGVVGLASIHIWGFEGGDDTEFLAVQRGVAFQLTNILRDLREDARKGRIYLPLDELSAMHVSQDDLRQGNGGKHFLELMRFQISRAEAFYEKSAGLERRISGDSRPTLIAMTEIYRGLLKKVAYQPERVLRERVSLSLFSKLRIGWRASRASRGHSTSATL
ncbi:MAG TPA: phytoene/squalene synthase family protein [Tepidisphaeraceae bacterium]